MRLCYPALSNLVFGLIGAFLLRNSLRDKLSCHILSVLLSTLFIHMACITDYHTLAWILYLVPIFVGFGLAYLNWCEREKFVCGVSNTTTAHRNNLIVR